MEVPIESLLDPEIATEPPMRYVEAIVRRAGTSFFWAMRKMEPKRRRALYAVYAFCRVVDDVADSRTDIERKVELLNAWREQIDLLHKGRPQHPITKELHRYLHSHDLDKSDFIAIIDGMELDAQPSVRIATIAELETYCDRVACAVGRLCVKIFGLENTTGKALAFELGMALQLTNILRDIAEDSGRDRIYLPMDWLREAGAEDSTLQEALTAAGFPDVCQRIAEKAQHHFQKADEIMSQSDRVRVRPAKMMMGIYRKTLERLCDRGWQQLNIAVGPTRVEKFWIAVRYGFLS